MKLFQAMRLPKLHSTRQPAAPAVDAEGMISPTSYRSSLPWRVFNHASTWADRKWGWDRLPVPVSLVVLIGVRNELRRKNLYDTDTLSAANVPPVSPPTADDTVRTFDGTYNDLKSPQMGMAGARFGRNVPLSSVDADPDATILEPNPREVSRRLLTRTEFQPATTVNVLVVRLAPVHDQGLVQPRSRATKDRAYRGAAVGRRRLWPQRPDAGPADGGRPDRDRRMPTGHRASSTPSPTGGTCRRSTARLEEEQRQYRAGEGGKLRMLRATAIPLPPDDPHQGPDAGARVLGRARHAGQPVRPRAQRHLRPARSGSTRTWSRRRALPARPAGQRRARRQDPHRRVDPGRDRPSHDEDRDARQLVRLGRRAAPPALRPAQRQRDHQRHPRLGDAALRRAVLADRGVRRGLPDAPADPRRLRPASRRRPGRPPANASFRELAGPASRGGLRADAPGGPVLLVRHRVRRRHRAAQLPARRCSTSSAPTTASSWTSLPSTSCAPAKRVSRATTSSGDCCDCSLPATFDDLTDDSSPRGRHCARSTAETSRRST